MRKMLSNAERIATFFKCAPGGGGRFSVKRKPNRPARRTQAAAGRLTG